ncbi:MAG TPA: hypothetical protein VMR80_10575 [Candidatus Acidoferrum sp.]|nr:hypothetical protein [Candidatus Acidoferrum sp.]
MADIDQETAKLRWPGYEITGAGRIGVVHECCRKVVLVSTPIEAQVISRERCGKSCSHIIAPDGRWHVIRKLDEPTRGRNTAETFGNIAALMERD